MGKEGLVEVFGAEEEQVTNCEGRILVIIS